MGTNMFLQNLNIQLTSKYKNHLRIEEDHWRMRFRINWINDGDTNIKCYHISVLNCRRRNNISFFKDIYGAWISSHLNILNHTLNYFQRIFSTSHHHIFLHNPEFNNTSCHNIDMSTLDYPLQDHEIIKAVYSFRPSKSPRPDSLHLSFYQKHWEIVGKSVLETYHSIFKYVTMPLTPLTFVLFRKFPMQIIL